MLHDLYGFIKLVLKTVTKTKKGKDKKTQQPSQIPTSPFDITSLPKATSL